MGQRPFDYDLHKAELKVKLFIIDAWHVWFLEYLIVNNLI